MEQPKQNELPIACALSALTAEQRMREGELLEEHDASIGERRERPDGYSYTYRNDPALFARMAELVSLEHRCCPFLDFRLEWAGAEDAPWLHILGGPRVKRFVAARSYRRALLRSRRRHLAGFALASWRSRRNDCGGPSRSGCR